MEERMSISRQIERFVNKVAQKFPVQDESSIMSDIHLFVSPETGEPVASDDDDNEITRCVIEQWIETKNENFYDAAAKILREELERLDGVVSNLGILKPYSFVLEGDEHRHIAELYLADDEFNIIGGDLLEDWDKDLDAFFDKLMSDDA